LLCFSISFLSFTNAFSFSISFFCFSKSFIFTFMFNNLLSLDKKNIANRKENKVKKGIHSLQLLCTTLEHLHRNPIIVLYKNLYTLLPNCPINLKRKFIC
jgi:hypothetical protein